MSKDDGCWECFDAEQTPARLVRSKDAQEQTIRTLADECMKQITRVRDQVMPAYLAIGPAGSFALMQMRAVSDTAIRALAEQNALEVMIATRVLKTFEA